MSIEHCHEKEKRTWVQVLLDLKVLVKEHFAEEQCLLLLPSQPKVLQTTALDWWLMIV